MILARWSHSITKGFYMTAFISEKPHTPFCGCFYDDRKGFWKSVLRSWPHQDREWISTLESPLCDYRIVDLSAFFKMGNCTKIKAAFPFGRLLFWAVPRIYESGAVLYWLCIHGMLWYFCWGSFEGPHFFAKNPPTFCPVGGFSYLLWYGGSAG